MKEEFCQDKTVKLANKKQGRIQMYVARSYNNLITALKTVFSSKEYFIYTFFFFIFFYAFNILVTNYSYLINKFSFSFVLTLLIGSVKFLPYFALFQLILTSFLAGIVFSMSLYLIRRQFSVAVGTGSAPMLAAIISPTCPSCAIGLLSVFGLGGIFSVLPFGGQELGPITIAILLLSMIYLSSKINTITCNIN